MVCHRPVPGSFLWATRLDSACFVAVFWVWPWRIALHDVLCGQTFHFSGVRASQWDCWSHLNSVQLPEQLSNTSYVRQVSRTG